MKFAVALGLLEEGKRVTSPSLYENGDYIAMNDGSLAVFDVDGEWLDDVVLNADFLGANFLEVPTVVEPTTMLGYFNVEKGRWMSTNNPEGLIAKGIVVKTFIVQD